MAVVIVIRTILDTISNCGSALKMQLAIGIGGDWIWVWFGLGICIGKFQIDVNVYVNLKLKYVSKKPALPQTEYQLAAFSYFFDRIVELCIRLSVAEVDTKGVI